MRSPLPLKRLMWPGFAGAVVFGVLALLTGSVVLIVIAAISFVLGYIGFSRTGAEAFAGIIEDD